MEYDVGCKLRRLPCEHVFHSDCVQEWFEHERTCPYCKADVANAINDLYGDELRAEGNVFESTAPDRDRLAQTQTTTGQERGGGEAGWGGRGDPPADSDNPFHRASIHAMAEDLMMRTTVLPSFRRELSASFSAPRAPAWVSNEVEESRSMSFSMLRYLAAADDEIELSSLTIQVDDEPAGEVTTSP
jgi:hypothetical protein